jgi:hypothetical protein
MLAVNVLVTCSNKKTISGGLALRSIPRVSIPERAANWTLHLASDVARVPAHELYGGEHWSVVKSLRGVAGENGVTSVVWICSAGYGLVSWASPLQPYAATFADRHPDSVANRAERGNRRVQLERWWACLAGWSGPRPGDPRTLVDLVAQVPSTPLIVAVSPGYLQAISSDLKDAHRRMRSDVPLIVLTCDAKMARELEEISILCDARLQRVVHGPRNSLNVRILRSLLSSVRNIGISVETWRSHVASLLTGQPPVQKYDRRKVTDLEIREFVRRELEASSTMSHTVLLRKLRDGGRACEQARFRGLYASVTEERRA